jgi:hypothetical protein
VICGEGWMDPSKSGTGGRLGEDVLLLAMIDLAKLAAADVAEGYESVAVGKSGTSPPMALSR